MASITQPSVMSLLLETCSDNAALGTATGFIVERAGAFYLITNRHVLRGRHQDTNEPLHPSLAVPSRVRIVHNKNALIGQYVIAEEPVYSEFGDPLWREHPILGGAVDVVALELTQTDDVAIYSYDPWKPGALLAFGPSDWVSIIGFPFGRTAGAALGIWVGGTIASEPGIDILDRPVMLVDSRTRPGSSGSPVIAYRSGGAVPMENGDTSIFTAPVWRFLGVYSGRINPESDLGYVWKAQVVREIIAPPAG